MTLRLEDVYSLASETNAIFPGTVSVVILDYRRLSHIDDQHIAEAKRIFGGSSNSSNYKIGVGLPINTARTTQQTPALLTLNIVLLLTQADIAVFTMLPHDNFVQSVVNGSGVAYFLEVFQNAKARLGISIPAVFSIGWPDTNNHGFTSYFNLAAFWKGISEKLASLNTTVIFDGAFDRPNQEQTYFKTMGWWRLVPNSSYRNSSDYIFEEKLHLVTENDGDFNNFWTNYSLSRPNEDVRFSHDLVIVQFEAFQMTNHFQEGAYNASSLKKLIRLVSTKFRKLIMRTFPKDEVDTSASLLPLAVAEINRERSRDQLKPLELIIPLNLEGSVQPFINTRKYVKEANSIFPNTVTTILLDSRTIEKVFIPDMLDFMNEDYSSSTQTNAQLGLYQSISSCFGPVDGSNFDANVTSLLRSSPHLRVMGFIFEVGLYRMMLGLNRIMAQMTTSFESCKMKIKQVAPQVSVIFYVRSWSDRYSESVTNYAQLINFWEGMNEWAIRTNTTIVLDGAFDTLNHNEAGKQHCGWWKLIWNASYQHVSEFEFEEKKASKYQSFRFE